MPPKNAFLEKYIQKAINISVYLFLMLVKSLIFKTIILLILESLRVKIKQIFKIHF